MVSKILDPQIVQHYVAIHGEGRDVTAQKAEIIDIDPVHDLALLKISNELKPLKMGSETLQHLFLVRPNFDKRLL